MSPMNSDGEFVYDNDYTAPVESFFLDSSITDEMQRPEPVTEPEPVVEPSEEDVNGNAD